jgi:chromosome segregation ATPase
LGERYREELTNALDLWRGGNDGSNREVESFDVDEVLAASLRDSSSAQQAIDQLTREEKNLRRQRKAVNAKFKRLTHGRVWLVGRSNRIDPELGSYTLSREMRDATNATQDQAGVLRGEQLAEIESRIQAIDRALDQLKARAH